MMPIRYIFGIYWLIRCMDWPWQAIGAGVDRQVQGHAGLTPHTIYLILYTQKKTDSIHPDYTHRRRLKLTKHLNKSTKNGTNPSTFGIVSLFAWRNGVKNAGVDIHVQGRSVLTPSFFFYMTQSKVVAQWQSHFQERFSSLGLRVWDLESRV